MLKRTYGHVLVLPSQRLVRLVADDDFGNMRNQHHNNVSSILLDLFVPIIS